jgi:uncharacterized protein RhaS with RHS repeats
MQNIRIYMQARYYDPVIGRFYSNDPVGFTNVHTFNRYAYANNNPYKYIDPDGRTSTPFSMSQNAAKVRQLDKGKSSGEIIKRFTKMSLGNAEMIGGAVTFQPSVVTTGAITFMDGATEGSVVSEVLQTAGVDENTADGVGSIADVLLGGKGLIDNATDLGSAFLKTDGLSSIMTTTVKATAEVSLIQVEAGENKDNIKNILKDDESK